MLDDEIQGKGWYEMKGVAAKATKQFDLDLASSHLDLDRMLIPSTRKKEESKPLDPATFKGLSGHAKVQIARLTTKRQTVTDIVADVVVEEDHVKVNTAQLVPGNYVGQITLNGMDAKGNLAPGSPQAMVVNLVMQPPCTLSPPSSSALSFSAVQSASTTPAVQTVMFTGTGSCVWPLSWKTTIAPAASWLTQTASSGSIAGTGQSGSVGVGVGITGLVAGIYKTTDGGNNWVSVLVTVNSIRGLALDPQTGNIYGASFGSGLYKSTNQGASWTQLTVTDLTRPGLSSFSSSDLVTPAAAGFNVIAASATSASPSLSPSVTADHASAKGRR